MAFVKVESSSESTTLINLDQVAKIEWKTGPNFEEGREIRLHLTGGHGVVKVGGSKAEKVKRLLSEHEVAF